VITAVAAALSACAEGLKVTVRDGKNTYIYYTGGESTVADVLREPGISIGEDDNYEEPYQEHYHGQDPVPEGPYIVSKIAFPNCADGSHGYYEITYSDGHVECEEY